MVREDQDKDLTEEEITVLVGKLEKKGFKVKKGFGKKNTRQENGFDENGSWKKCSICIKRCKHGGEKCQCPASNHLTKNCFFNKDKEGKEAKRKRKEDKRLLGSG